MWNHALVLCVHLFPSCEAVRLKIKKWMTACSMLQYLIILSLIRLWMNVYLIFVEIQQFNWGTCKIFILLRCSFSQTAELIITKKNSSFMYLIFCLFVLLLAKKLEVPLSHEETFILTWCPSSSVSATLSFKSLQNKTCNALIFDLCSDFVLI